MIAYSLGRLTVTKELECDLGTKRVAVKHCKCERGRVVTWPLLLRKRLRHRNARNCNGLATNACLRIGRMIP